MVRQITYALIVVDLQIDFCPGGALGISEGDSIIPVINDLIDIFHANSLPVIFSRDFHPVDHMSFTDEGGIWPKHCVKGTEGSDFHPLLKIPSDSRIVNKATEKDREAYSAFDGTELLQILRNQKVTCIIICGLATDYCVKSTALDGVEEGFRVIVVKDAVRGVEVTEGDIYMAFEKMMNAGVTVSSSAEVKRNLSSLNTE